jgi:hypothetical protein
MARRAWLPHLAAIAGYLVVAWPSPGHWSNLSTHFTGDPGGDTGVYVWNQWVFQHEALAERRNPLTTEQILSTTGRPVDPTQHNYTLFANVTAWMTFVLARVSRRFVGPLQSRARRPGALARGLTRVGCAPRRWGGSPVPE